jgi:hypothetical protein
MSRRRLVGDEGYSYTAVRQNRRLATRYEKRAVTFLAVVKLAMIQRCLRLLHSSDRTELG